MTKQELKSKFFKECVDSFEGQLPKVNLTPHNMFEWFWSNLVEPKPKIECKQCKGFGFIDSLNGEKLCYCS